MLMLAKFDDLIKSFGITVYGSLPAGEALHRREKT